MGIEDSKPTFTTSTSNITRVRVTRICTSSEISNTCKKGTITTTQVTDRVITDTNNRGTGKITHHQLMATNNTLPTKMPIMMSKGQFRMIEA